MSVFFKTPEMALTDKKVALWDKNAPAFAVIGRPSLPDDENVLFYIKCLQGNLSTS